jgi:hypothetical protein
MAGLNDGPRGDEWKDVQAEEDARAHLAGAKKRQPQTDRFKAANIPHKS